MKILHFGGDEKTKPIADFWLETLNTKSEILNMVRVGINSPVCRILMMFMLTIFFIDYY
jgi:hypothetical protein